MMIYVYGVACSQEENGQKQKQESIKPKIDALRKNFDMVSIINKTCIFFI